MYPRERMRTLVYKQTHLGDPSARGVWGKSGCMGRVRLWPYDAVVGVGGRGAEPKLEGIADQLTWMGIGPCWRGKLVTFEHYLAFEKGEGPVLRDVAPKLARRMRHARFVMDSLSATECAEVERLLEMATGAPPSGAVSDRARKSCSKKRRRAKSDFRSGI